MPSQPKLKWIAAIAAAAALLALPAAAQATLAFTRNPLKPVVFAANDDGSGAHKVDSGRNPKVSPDGQSIAYLHEGPGHAQELVLAPASGGASRTLMVGWQDPFYLAFSPDSKTIAALRGPELGKLKLVLIDVASGTQQVVDSGYFSGFSFSPDSTELVYSKAGTEKYPPLSDVYRFEIPIGESVRFVPPIRLTHDHRSINPLWGPTGKIVFVKLIGAKQRKYGPKNELYLMNPSGGQVKRLTHTVVDPLVQGLTPTQWSASGNRLLAEFGGQDTTYAVTVNPKTGTERTLTKEREVGFVGTALSADGSTVLGDTGGFEPGPDHKVVTIPYTGGKPKVLAKNASEPSWSR
jgi:dipeptidyl aminopeptidase/acylaminoacyl peptidase